MACDGGFAASAWRMGIMTGSARGQMPIEL
jgi:hypothetical protein